MHCTSKNNLFAFLCLFLSQITFSQVIPPELIIPICSGQSISTSAPENTGVNHLNIPCEFQSLSPYMDFYYVKIASGTTFAFTIDPVGMDDYDFGAWLNPDWSDIKATPLANKRGSQNHPFHSMIFSMGLSLTATDTCESGGSTGDPEPGMVRYFDVQAGDEILIAIDRWSVTTDGYTLSFGGDAILDCTITGDEYRKCDLDQNNQEDFVAQDFLPDLEAKFTNHTFEFYLTKEAAEEATSPPISFPFTVLYNNGEATEIYVRVVNANGELFRVLKLFLSVEKTPELNNRVIELPSLCDSGNGTADFDLTLSTLDLINNPGNFHIQYYTNETAANVGEDDFIPDPTFYNSNAAIVYARVAFDDSTTSCYDVAEIHLKVDPQPNISINESLVTLCPSDVFQATATSDDPTAQFIWYLNGQIVGTDANLDIFQNGIYTVEAISLKGCTNEISLEVRAPNPPTITGVEMGQNHLIVAASAGENKHLDYSLDQVFWQASPRFDHLTPGKSYTIYVRENNCLIDQLEVHLLLITNFISPNGDGKNDTWMIQGSTADHLVHLKLFDRYGKLFVDKTFQGKYVWDGKYLGRTVPSGDYWYIIEILSSDLIEGQRYVGHLSVRNR
ncbi:MAG TPA: T9SS type B sorting domain-containing protein [Moheibacter sp.]|nr:T9SS type B sorting domain-containing protein [Moheibacter sp.]